MIQLNNNQVRNGLPWPKLVAAIETALLADGIGTPPRAQFELAAEGSETGHLLIMPAWQGAATIGVKMVVYRPDNARYGLESHIANYILMDGRSGEMKAVLDGEELTARRTAAVSVIAAKRLMRADARRLLVVGAGPVARNLASAYAAFHDFDTIEVFARNRGRAQDLICTLAEQGITASIADDLAGSAQRADVISMATSARAPVLLGDWIAPGTHIDLVGSFTPDMRETDDAVMAKASSVWVDTDNALRESGDLVHPLADGVLDAATLKGDLHALVVNPPRRGNDEVTVFKAVGFALPDLAAARCALEANAALAQEIV